VSRLTDFFDEMLLKIPEEYQGIDGYCFACSTDLFEIIKEYKGIKIVFHMLMPKETVIYGQYKDLNLK